MKRKTPVTVAVLCALALALAAQERGPAPAVGFRISGVVVNSTNNLPVAQAYVTVTLAGTPGVKHTLMTGDDGRFVFDGLRAGKYALAAERHGFRSQGYEQHEGLFSSAIVVGPDHDGTNLVFRISPEVSLSGLVTDDSSEPVRNARVMLIHEMMVEGRLGKRMVANSLTDDRGHYHFGHLSPGTYYIAVAARPWYAQPRFMGRMGVGVVVFDSGRTMGDGTADNPALDVTYPLTFYPDVTDATSASTISVRAGDRASADIMLRAVPALHVRINNSAAPEPKGQDPRPFMGATLVQTVFDGIEIPLQTMMREMNGRIVMMGIPPGHYLLRLLANARRFAPMPAPAGDDEPQTGRVREVDLTADTELDAGEMAATAMVSGTVKLANGQAPSKPPTIQLRRGAMQRTFGARANANGEFKFSEGFTAGSYEVIMSSGGELFIRSVRASGARLAGRMLHISGSDPVKLTIVAGAGTGTVEGVAERDGKLQSGVMILLVPQDPENNLPLFRRDQSDSDGGFTLSTVLPGRYTLLALEKGWDLQWSFAAVLKPLLPGGEPVVVEANGRYKVSAKVQ